MASFELEGGRLTVKGVLDADAEPELKDLCAKLLLCDVETVKIDLSAVESITSLCIGVLVVLRIDLRAAGRGVELAASPAVRRVLDMTGLSSVFAGAAKQ